MTPDDEARRIFHDAGALLENDHFVYVSGEYGSGWIDKDVVYPRPRNIVPLSELLEYRYLATVRIPAWPAATCALCAAGAPVNTRYAHGAEITRTRATDQPPRAESAAGSRS